MEIRLSYMRIYRKGGKYMTSSNVSNLLVQVSNISVEMSDSKVDVSVNKGLFENDSN